MNYHPYVCLLAPKKGSSQEHARCSCIIRAEDCWKHHQTTQAGQETHYWTPILCLHERADTQRMHASAELKRVKLRQTFKAYSSRFIRFISTFSLHLHSILILIIHPHSTDIHFIHSFTDQHWRLMQQFIFIPHVYALESIIVNYSTSTL